MTRPLEIRNDIVFDPVFTAATMAARAFWHNTALAAAQTDTPWLVPYSFIEVGQGELICELLDLGMWEPGEGGYTICHWGEWIR